MGLKTRAREGRGQKTLWDAILTAAVALLGEGVDLSMRAVAMRIGVTAPALYRYVASHEELVRLVARDVSRRAVTTCVEEVACLPEEDAAARLVVASAAFRRWALSQPAQFRLVFSSPGAVEPERREPGAPVTWDRVFTDLLLDVWRQYRFDRPELGELDPSVREWVLDEDTFPAEVVGLRREDRGVLLECLKTWAALSAVVSLEVSGHCDPRVVDSGGLFRAALLDRLAPLGLAAESERLTDVLVNAGPL